MTNILPILTASIGGAAGWGMLGPPGVAIGIPVGATIGWASKYGGHGRVVTGRERKLVTGALNRLMAANWGMRPATEAQDADGAAELLNAMYDAVARDLFEQNLEQWGVLKAHAMRAHLSGIPPMAAMAYVRRNHRDGLFRKNGHIADGLAEAVVTAYGAALARPLEAHDWYARWTAAIGIKPARAQQIWDAHFDALRERAAWGDIEQAEGMEDGSLAPGA